MVQVRQRPPEREPRRPVPASVQREPVRGRAPVRAARRRAPEQPRRRPCRLPASPLRPCATRPWPACPTSAHRAVVRGSGPHVPRVTTDAVGLCLLDARRVTLHVDTERQRQVERLLVRHAELLGELVQADVLRHLAVSLSSFGNRRRTADDSGFSHVFRPRLECVDERQQPRRIDTSTECPAERPTANGRVAACRGIGAEPRATPRYVPVDDRHPGVGESDALQLASGGATATTDTGADGNSISRWSRPPPRQPASRRLQPIVRR